MLFRSKTQNTEAAHAVGDQFLKAHPFKPGTKPLTINLGELKLNQTWRPTLSVTGLEGIPELENAGNVRLPSVEVKLSFRLPPTVNPEEVIPVIKNTLEKNPPHGASVTFNVQDFGAGWEAPAEKAWLLEAGNKASQLYYQKPMMLSGGGGSIPFMGMLGEKFPQAQFVITGVLGPNSNAHGPNEFIHLGYAKKLTASIAYLLVNASRLNVR